MARIRSVHPDICESEVLASLSAELERTFTRLWTYLDDQGRGKDDPRLIKAAIYALSDSQTWEVVDKELGLLAEAGLVIRWEQDGKKYIACRPESWDEYQHPQKPRQSKCPTPPGYVEIDYRPRKDEVTHSSGSLPKDSGTLLNSDSTPTVQVRETYSPVVVDVGVVVDVDVSSEVDTSAPRQSQRPNTPEANQLLRDWVEAETPHRQITKNSWPGKVAAIRSFLNNGWTVEQLRPIVLRSAVISTDAIQLEIGRHRRNPPGGRPSVGDRNTERIKRVVGDLAGQGVVVTTVAELESGVAS